MRELRIPDVAQAIHEFTKLLTPCRYHEDFADWNFGKMSALREISLAEENGYDFYYMGWWFSLSSSEIRHF